MKILNRSQLDRLNCYHTLRAFIALLAQLKSKHSFIDTSPTQQVVMPFDLGDVARAFNGSFASRFAHLEDQSND